MIVNAPSVPTTPISLVTQYEPNDDYDWKSDASAYFFYSSEY